MKILIVDDEPKILEIIDAYLVASQYTVFKASNGLMALEKFDSHHPDLIVLDLMLPDMDGLTVAKKIRETSDVPIIMLTAKSEEEDILKGLKLGADDYMVKPFSPKELVARIETVLRRVPNLKEINKLSRNNGELLIQMDSRQVFLKNQEIALTTSEFDILQTLAESPNRAFSRSDLIEIIKGFDFDGLDRSIDSHVKNLRHKIETNPKEPNYILTVHGTGYRFGYPK
ncbi:response regulator transcription factor [Vagococcus carniphilus]|uniref:Response regulator transcription factor n=1 Tax=Vagococcus carniphilus TaxID=218144 RepID=A0AAW8U2F8_9ENTE|nr:response regulator transcription factor [Vagococcus carniphilus]MDT2815186.1 response regulator transcription factor [Vagococcus carniphilus]MDT2831092.1 response regulator transcription factor [Vagococcus carniphilus]MDT2833279.1 response regulator transcription factor [Vagococcus carniphilus]MDT2839749.1 response regulator transcription factor [Vagococcus carniphilus]MDT2854218.1 response regulator transcription factor [Vagococcus carniphilus]